MPTVATEGGLRFVVRTKEQPFEPPHVHVFSGGEQLCRIELLHGTFMEDPPPGTAGRIRDAYRAHAETIWEAWDRIHGR